MATYYLDHDAGDDTNLGTSEGSGNAWKTVFKACQTVAANDKVWIKDNGSYVEEDGSDNCIGLLITWGGVTTPITFEGYTSTTGDGGRATLDASTNTLANVIKVGYGASKNAYLVFRNLRFTGASGHGVDIVTGFYARTSLFENCRFDNNGADGLEAHQLMAYHKCEFDNNTDEGFVGNSYSGLTCCSFHDNGGTYSVGGVGIWGLLFMYNLVYNQATSGVLCGLSSLIANNTIIGTNETTGDGIVALTSAHIVINNIVETFDDGITGNNIYALHNLLNDITTNNYSATVISENFIHGSSPDLQADYELNLDSPCRFAGIDAGFMHGGQSFVDIGAIQAPMRHERPVNDFQTGW